MASHLSNCPLCLEQLHQPKSLPCLHSFCKECLSTFITTDLSGKMASATSFPCPVCRKMTQPANPSEDKEKWAQKFPTHVLPSEREKSVLQELNYCKPCGKLGNTTTPATIWCKTCNVLLCDTCKVVHHDLIHEACNTIDVIGKDSIMHPQVSPHVMCEKHSEEMEYYCEDHQILGCSRCITIDHRRCDVVTTTQEYCDKLKRDSRLDDLKASLKKTMEAIEELIKEFDEQLQSLLEDQYAGLKSLADLRQRINTRLDTMQNHITDELIATYKREKENLDMFMQKSKRLISSIQNTIDSPGADLQNDFVDTILLYQRGQAEVKSYHNLVAEMTTSLRSVRIKHIVEQDLFTFDKNFPLSLGQVSVEKKSDYRLGLVLSPLSECGVTEIIKFSIKCPSDGTDCYANGVVYLSNEHIVVGDSQNHKIKLFTASGKWKDEMKVQGEPCDMCRVDDHTVAVANYDEPVIYVIKVESSKLTLTSEIKLSNGKSAMGITSTGEGFTVSSWQELYSVQQNGNMQQTETNPSNCYHLAYDPKSQHIYGSQITSTRGRVVVYRLSDGSRMDIATVGVLKDALGVDVDGEGNVYVCGRESNNVVQMSGDGTHVRELLTSSDGVDRPRGISVCDRKFVVTNQSSRNRNYIHVFQLS